MTKKKKAKKTEYVYQPKTEEELKEIALGVMSGTIFTSANLSERETTLVFMALALADQATLDQMQRDEITLIYEHIRNALPRSVNGMPMFTSFYMLNKSDHHRLVEMVQKLQSAIDAV